MLILASSSPRRREMFDMLPIPYKTVVSDADESVSDGLLPYQAAQEIALRKALAVANSHPSDIVVGADTIVVADGEIFGKPADRADAARMLRAYSGKTHEVITGVAVVYSGGRRVFSDRTLVTFRAISEEEIERYISTDEPYDKAGGYAVQGCASLFIESVEGNYNNVVGLPICKLWTELKPLLNG